MKFLQKSEERTEVNLTPLIDVVFLLLIFFMVTTTFNQQARLRVDLPDASESSISKENDTLEVIVDQAGNYYLDERKLLDTHAQTLVSALQKTMEGRTAENASVIIRADGRAPHQSVVTVMDAAAKLGISRVSIATSNSEQ